MRALSKIFPHKGASDKYYIIERSVFQNSKYNHCFPSQNHHHRPCTDSTECPVVVP